MDTQQDSPQVPAWYMSTNGPEISGTLKYLCLLILPTLKDIFGLQIGPAEVDHLIDATLIIAFSVMALIHYRQAKKNLGSTISKLIQDNEKLTTRIYLSGK